MRAYELLLLLYPTAFRNEYGDEMRAVTARRRRDAHTLAARALFDMALVLDTLSTAAVVHWDILRQDLRYSARTLGRSRGFALTAIAIVTLGIGATTATFSLADFVLIRPLPFPEPQRLVRVWETKPGYQRFDVSPANFRDFRQFARSFDAFGAYRGLSVNVAGRGEPLRLEGAVLTVDVLEALGVAPLMGRPINADDDREDAPGVILLSYALWQSEYGGDPGVVGTTLRLDDRPSTIIGVMPRDFYFPSRDAMLWTAMRFQSVEFNDRNDEYLSLIARLAPGATLESARADMQVVASQLKQQYAKENVNTGATVVPVRDDLSRPSALTLIALAGAAACVLLIACANLANLLLARALARRRELAVRQALGAGRERLVRQLLTESLILAGTGGVLGVLFAALTMPLLSQLVPDSLPIAATPGLDLRVLMFAAAATTVTGLVFGMVPALYGRASAGSDGLRDGARAGERGRERLRGILVVVEIALSVVLLVSGGLLLRALERIQRIDPGFATEHILTARTSLPMPKFENRAPREQFYTRVLSNLRALPGVSSAAYISFLPMGDNRGGIWPVGLHGPEAERRENQVATLRYVTPGFFSTLSIPILRGRDVDDADTASRPYVAVVSQSFAMRFWPDQDPIGRHFFFAFSDRTVVGVVGDIHVRGLTRQSEPQVYVPFNQVADSALTWYAPKDLAIRTTGDPLSIASSLRRIVHEADPRQPLSEVRPLTDVVGEDTAPRAMQLRIIGGFALMAVLLAAVGIHGLLSFAVSQRTHEIGVRRALGASSVDIVTMVVRRSTWLAAVGILAGVAIAYYAGRTMESLLAGVKPADTLTLASAVTLAAVMTLAGSALPTLRAVRVNPTEALRAE